MKSSLFGLALAAGFVAALTSTASWSQTTDRVRRVGVLFSGSASDPATRPVLQALVDGFREHGWEERSNLVLEVRYAGPDPARFAELATELAALPVDVIMTANTQALEAARRNAARIPIVLAGATVPLKLGFVASLARPGGNITGVVNQAETVVGKHLELLKEIKPGIERVGIVYSPDNVASLATFTAQRDEMAPRLGLAVVPIPVSKPADIDEAFATIARERPQALEIYAAPVIFAHRGKIAQFAIEHRLLTVGGLSVMGREGLLMSYGYDNRASWRRAASYADRIFKGASPADLPVEQVDRFELIVNLRTARAIGRPKSLLGSSTRPIILLKFNRETSRRRPASSGCSSMSFTQPMHVTWTKSLRP